MNDYTIYRDYQIFHGADPARLRSGQSPILAIGPISGSLRDEVQLWGGSATHLRAQIDALTA